MSEEKKDTGKENPQQTSDVEHLKGEVVDTTSGKKVKPVRKKAPGDGKTINAKSTGETVLEVLKGIGGFLLMLLKMIGVLFVKLF